MRSGRPARPYIASQKSEGWALVRDQYDDGGISGGTLERPALQQLLADIEDGLGRCGRCLQDRPPVALADGLFQAGRGVRSQRRDLRLRHAVLQHDHLHGAADAEHLLSFAQFEREVTAERIRDKVKASRMKGMWMGGYVPLGYDVHRP